MTDQSGIKMKSSPLEVLRVGCWVVFGSGNRFSEEVLANCNPGRTANPE